jgi:rifampicin phosphotransferase
LRLRRARRILLGALAHGYEALGRYASALVERPEFARGRGARLAVLAAGLRAIGPIVFRVPAALLVRNPATGARALGRALATLPRQVGERVRAGATPGDRVRQLALEMSGIFARLRPLLPWIMSGVLAHRLLGRLARGAWADDVRGDVDLLLRGLPGNVTTEMDLAVGDLTDLARPHPELAHLLQTLPWAEARARLPRVAGGPEFLTAFESFLSRYGERGAGEIDSSRPRWRDDPALLLRVIAGGLSAHETGAHRRQHRAQAAAGEAAAARLAVAAGRGPAGPLRRWLVRRLTRVARTGLGLREHPKFLLVQILGLLRSEILPAGEALARRGQIATPAEVWHLGFEELAGALADPGQDLREVTAARAAAFERDRLRKPPIVMSSDGETPTLASARSDLPAGALPGTAASAGVVEGLARVVTDPEREVLHAGEILVAPFTDPGWTPLFVHAAGLVTEVGGLMTHGAVVAREYGIPAVVSVESAVARIKTGQRIRLDGTRGFVQLLEPA